MTKTPGTAAMVMLIVPASFRCWWVGYRPAVILRTKNGLVTVAACCAKTTSSVRPSPEEPRADVVKDSGHQSNQQLPRITPAPPVVAASCLRPNLKRFRHSCYSNTLFLFRIVDKISQTSSVVKK